MIFKLLVALIGTQHFIFMILEMFFWNKPLGQKIFKIAPDFAAQSATLAANQGLYNGFLAAGLFWSLFQTDLAVQKSFMLFFVGCVAVAGMYGGYSVSKGILLVQGIPAIVVFFLIYFLK